MSNDLDDVSTFSAPPPVPHPTWSGQSPDGPIDPLEMLATRCENMWRQFQRAYTSRRERDELAANLRRVVRQLAVLVALRSVDSPSSTLQDIARANGRGLRTVILIQGVADEAAKIDVRALSVNLEASAAEREVNADGVVGIDTRPGPVPSSEINVNNVGRGSGGLERQRRVGPHLFTQRKMARQRAL